MSVIHGTYNLFLDPTKWSYSCELRHDELSGTFVSKPRLTIEAQPSKAASSGAVVHLPSGKTLAQLPVTIYIYLGKTPETEVELAGEVIQMTDPRRQEMPFKSHLGWFTFFQGDDTDGAYVELMLDGSTFSDIASCVRSSTQRLVQLDLGLFGSKLVQEQSFTSLRYRWDGQGQLRVGSLGYRIDPV